MQQFLLEFGMYFRKYRVFGERRLSMSKYGSDKREQIKKELGKKQEVHCKLKQPLGNFTLLNQHLYSQQPSVSVTLALVQSLQFHMSEQFLCLFRHALPHLKYWFLSTLQESFHSLYMCRWPMFAPLSLFRALWAAVSETILRCAFLL